MSNDRRNPETGPPYTFLHEPKLTSELTRLSSAKSTGTTDSVSFQGCCNPTEASQDRHVIKDIVLDSGTWKFRAVYDGTSHSLPR